MSGDIEARLNKLRRFSSGGSLRQDYEGTYFIAEEVLAILADAKAGISEYDQGAIDSYKEFRKMRARAENAEAAIAEREGFYEKLWKDFCSLQRGNAQGIVAKVEQYYQEQAAKAGRKIAHPPEPAAEKAAPDSGLRVDVSKLLYIRDCLIKGDTDEAYHMLYSMADPKFEKTAPWQEWEALQPPAPAGPEDSVFQRTGEMIAQQLRTALPEKPAQEAARRWRCEKCGARLRDSEVHQKTLHSRFYHGAYKHVCGPVVLEKGQE
jgi:hypothetical protein